MKFPENSQKDVQLKKQCKKERKLPTLHKVENKVMNYLMI